MMLSSSPDERVCGHSGGASPCEPRRMATIHVTHPSHVAHPSRPGQEAAPQDDGGECCGGEGECDRHGGRGGSRARGPPPAPPVRPPRHPQNEAPAPSPPPPVSR